jgi:glycosyltransferase involved in cell wall biosynthesis
MGTIDRIWQVRSRADRGTTVTIAFILTRSDALGGSQVHVIDLCRGLRMLGYNPRILIGGCGSVCKLIEDAGIPVYSIAHLTAAISPLADSLALREIYATLRRIKPDIVSTHTAKAGALGRLACLALGLPVIYTAHGWSITDRISPRQGGIFRSIEKISGLYTDFIINVCEHERQLARTYSIAPPHKLGVVHNGVPDVPMALLADPSADPPHLVSIARMESPKDPFTLLRALSGLMHLSWSAELIGDGPLLTSAQDLAKTLGIGSRVKFAGKLQYPEHSLASAQIFLLSSRFEGFPRTILEAMRAGLPVVVSDVGGVREAVHDSVTGFVIPAQDVTCMSQRLQRLITDPALRTVMGRNARTTYEQRFTLKQTVQKTAAVYAHVRGQRCVRRQERKELTFRDIPL